MIADNLSKAGWSWGLCVSRGFRRANNLDCWRTSRWRTAFRCASGWKPHSLYRTWKSYPRIIALLNSEFRDW